MGAGRKVASERHGKAAAAALLSTDLPLLVDMPKHRIVSGPSQAKEKKVRWTEKICSLFPPWR